MPPVSPRPRRLPPAWVELIEEQLSTVTHAGRTVITIEHGPSGAVVDLFVQAAALRASLVTRERDEPR